MGAYCPVCRREVGPGALIEPESVGGGKRAYVADPHVLQRAQFVVRARERESGEPVDWAYHLDFVWVDACVPGAVEGYWQRTLCGPVFIEPEMGWVI